MSHCTCGGPGHLFRGSLCFRVFKSRSTAGGEWGLINKGEGLSCLDLPCVAFCDISWGDGN